MILPPKTRARVVAALAVNPNATQVAKQIGVDAGTVMRIAKAEGIKLFPGGRPMAPDKRARIVAALTTFPNATRVAEKIGGVSGRTVSRIARDEGIRLSASTWACRPHSGKLPHAKLRNALDTTQGYDSR